MTLWHFNLNIFTKSPLLFLPPLWVWVETFFCNGNQPHSTIPRYTSCFLGMPFPLAKKRTLLFTVPLREWHAEKMKMLNKWLSPNGGIAWVYRLVLPTGRRGPFHNVLLLSRYLALRERFPYLTHSCKSELNSSNSENELQTCLLSIWTRGSCQGWGGLGDHPSDLLASSPLKTAAAPQHTPCALHSQRWGWGVGTCVHCDEGRG